MKSDNKNDLVIVYTIDSDDSEQVKLPIKAEDIYTNGVVDREKVIRLAVSNEVENDRAVLDPFVMDLSGNIIQ